MKPSHISVDRAITVGTLIVNVPVFVLLAGGAVVAAKFGEQWGGWAMAAPPVGFALAWLWWSLTVPRWRLWAYERAESVTELKRRSMAAGLTWPDGSVFAKTEIKSKEHAEKERALERDRA